jgi:S-phase kinase-associated protein 1
VDVASDDVQLSVLLKTVLEGVDEQGVEIPLPNVSHAVLEKLLDFMRHYKTDQMKPIEKPLPMNKEFVDVVGEWYHAFIEAFEGIDTLYELIKAADYMDIPPVHELACARIAHLIRGKEPNEIRKILGLTDGHE